MSETRPTRWRGVSATYSSGERLLVGRLKNKEQWFIHLLKSLTDGEIAEAPEPAVALVAPVASGVYTDPEDIPFGKPKKSRPIYGLVATPKLATQTKTKAEAEFWMKVWRKWYELKGWTVYGAQGSGYYIATQGDNRHAISLHEYDKETKERLP